MLVAPEAGLQRVRGLGEPDGDHRLAGIVAVADPDRLSVERGLAVLGQPELVLARVVDDAEDQLARVAEGDRDTVVGDAVEEVHGAVDGVDDPLPRAGLVAGDAFLAEDGVVGKGGQQVFADGVLALDVELDLDIEFLLLVDDEVGGGILAHHPAGDPGRLDGILCERGHGFGAGPCW